MIIPSVDGVYDTTMTSGQRLPDQINRILAHQKIALSLGGITVAQIIDWAQPDEEEFKPTNIVRNGNGAIVSADITWPNGAVGVLIIDVFSTDFLGAIDSYHVTYQLPGMQVRTLTQPVVTRDENGAVIFQPEIVIT